MPYRMPNRKELNSRILPREEVLIKHITCSFTALRFREEGRIQLARLAAHDARNNFQKWCALSETDDIVREMVNMVKERLAKKR